MPAILIPEPEVAYQILALNTEKAHNVKEKSLEVIRMYRGLVGGGLEGHRGGLRLPVRGPALHHARPPLRRAPRFAGGAFAPLLRRVDKFLKAPLPKAYAERERRAGARPGRRRRAGRGRRPRSRSAG